MTSRSLLLLLVLSAEQWRSVWRICVS